MREAQFMSARTIHATKGAIHARRAIYDGLAVNAWIREKLALFCVPPHPPYGTFPIKGKARKRGFSLRRSSAER